MQAERARKIDHIRELQKNASTDLTPDDLDFLRDMKETEDQVWDSVVKLYKSKIDEEASKVGHVVKYQTEDTVDRLVLSAMAAKVDIVEPNHSYTAEQLFDIFMPELKALDAKAAQVSVLEIKLDTTEKFLANAQDISKQDRDSLRKERDEHIKAEHKHQERERLDQEKAASAAQSIADLEKKIQEHETNIKTLEEKVVEAARAPGERIIDLERKVAQHETTIEERNREIRGLRDDMIEMRAKAEQDVEFQVQKAREAVSESGRTKEEVEHLREVAGKQARDAMEQANATASKHAEAMGQLKSDWVESERVLKDEQAKQVFSWQTCLSQVTEVILYPHKQSRVPRKTLKVLGERLINMPDLASRIAQVSQDNTYGRHLLKLEPSTATSSAIDLDHANAHVQRYLLTVNHFLF